MKSSQIKEGRTYKTKTKTVKIDKINERSAVGMGQRRTYTATDTKTGDKLKFISAASFKEEVTKASAERSCDSIERNYKRVEATVSVVSIG